MGLLDRFFKEETPKIIENSLTEELGDTGTTIYKGYLSSEDYNPDFSGIKKYTIFDKMRKGDATVAASLSVIKLPLRSANWFVMPAGKEKDDEEKAKFIEYNLKEAMSLTWDDFLRQALLMLDYGVYVFEKVFGYIEYEDKIYIGFKKFAPRHPKTIQQWEMSTGEAGIRQDLYYGKKGGQVDIPIEKLLIFVNNREGDNWEGISMLRSAYKHWFFKDIFEQIDAMSFERQGLGVPYVKLPQGASDQDKTNAKTLAKNLRANEKAFVVFPDGYEVGFLDMKAKSTRDPKGSIDYHNRQIVLNVLAQFLMLGAGESGSFALSKDQSGFFYDSLQAIAKNICDVVNKYAIKQLVDLNWPGTKNYPKLVVDNIGAIDKEKFVNAINTLTQSNIIIKDEELEKFVRKEMDLPDKQEGDEDDQETDNLMLQLDMLSADVAGEGELPQETQQVQAEMAEQEYEDEMQFNDMVDDEVMIFVAKGKSVSDETKSKISEALKQYWASRGHKADIENIGEGEQKIADAKRRIDELKTVVDSYKSKAKEIKDKKIKKEFNKKIKEKIAEIQQMIKNGRDGIKVEKERQRQAKGNIKKDIKDRRNELRKKRIEKRIERDLIRIERLETQHDKTDSPSERKKLRSRIDEIKDVINDRKQQVSDIDNNVFTEHNQKKNLRQLNDDFKPYRKLTTAEKKVNFGNIKNELEKKEGEFQELLKKALNDQKSDLLKEFKNAIEKSDYQAITNIALKYKGEYADEIFSKMKELYNFGKNGAAAEMKVTSPASPKDDMDRLKANASILVDDHEVKVMTKTKIKALDSIAKGVSVSKAMGAIEKTMQEAMDDLSQKTGSIIAGGSINQGRRLTQYTYKKDVYALQRSELLDDRTCNFCMSMDGRIVSLDDPWAQEDIFHSNCRGMWVEIMKDEEELPDISGVPKSIANKYDGMNDFKQLTVPNVKKSSLASDALKEIYKKEIADRENKITQYEKDNKYPNRIDAHKTKIEQMKKVLDNLE